MNSLFPGIEDVKMSSPTMVLTFDRDCVLPKLGEVMSDGDQYELVVTAVNKEDHSVQVLVNDALSMKERVLQKRGSLSKITAQLVSDLHKEISEGMLGLLSWEQLEKSQQDKYISAVNSLIKSLEAGGFIKYGPHDL